MLVEAPADRRFSNVSVRFITRRGIHVKDKIEAIAAGVRKTTSTGNFRDKFRKLGNLRLGFETVVRPERLAID
jgi:hypothetical protein